MCFFFGDDLTTSFLLGPSTLSLIILHVQLIILHVPLIILHVASQSKSKQISIASRSHRQQSPSASETRRFFFRTCNKRVRSASCGAEEDRCKAPSGRRALQGTERKKTAATTQRPSAAAAFGAADCRCTLAVEPCGSTLPRKGSRDTDPQDAARLDSYRCRWKSCTA